MKNLYLTTAIATTFIFNLAFENNRAYGSHASNGLIQESLDGPLQHGSSEKNEHLLYTFNELIDKPIEVCVPKGFTLEQFLALKKGLGKREATKDTLKAKENFFTGARFGDYACMLELSKLFLAENNFNEAIQLVIVSMQVYYQAQFLLTLCTPEELELRKSNRRVIYTEAYSFLEHIHLNILDKKNTFLTKKQKTFFTNNLKKILTHLNLNDENFFINPFLIKFNLAPNLFLNEKQIEKSSIFLFSLDLRTSNALDIRTVTGHFLNQAAIKQLKNPASHLIFGIENFYMAKRKTKEEGKIDLLKLLNNSNSFHSKDAYIRKILDTMEENELISLIKEDEIILSDFETLDTKGITNTILTYFAIKGEHHALHACFSPFSNDPWFDAGCVFYQQYDKITSNLSFHNEALKKKLEDLYCYCFNQTNSMNSYIHRAELLRANPSLHKNFEEKECDFFKKAVALFEQAPDIKCTLNVAEIIRYGRHGEKPDPDRALSLLLMHKEDIETKGKTVIESYKKVLFNNLGALYANKYYNSWGLQENKQEKIINLLKAIEYFLKSGNEMALVSFADLRKCIKPRNEAYSFLIWLADATNLSILEIIESFSQHFYMIEPLYPSRIDFLESYESSAQRQKALTEKINDLEKICIKTIRSTAEILMAKDLIYQILILLSASEKKDPRLSDPNYFFLTKSFFHTLIETVELGEKEEILAMYYLYRGNLNEAYLRFSKLALASYPYGIKGMRTIELEWEKEQIRKKTGAAFDASQPSVQVLMKKIDSLDVNSNTVPVEKATKKNKKDKREKVAKERKEKKEIKKQKKWESKKPVYSVSQADLDAYDKNPLIILFHNDAVKRDFETFEDSNKMKEHLRCIQECPWKTTGDGKPEVLKHMGRETIISRRLNHTDRLVYTVNGSNQITIKSVKGHYE